MDAFVAAIREDYVRSAWESCGVLPFEFGEATQHCFSALVAAPRRVRIRVCAGTVRVSLHETEAVGWHELADPELIAAAAALVEADAGCEAAVRDLTEELPLRESGVEYEYALTTPFAYAAGEWALPFLAHLFTQPQHWGEAEHDHAVNVLVHVLTTPVGATAPTELFPAAAGVVERLCSADAMDAAAWRGVLAALRG